jgi:hypothetical protein
MIRVFPRRIPGMILLPHHVALLALTIVLAAAAFVFGALPLAARLLDALAR